MNTKSQVKFVVKVQEMRSKNQNPRYYLYMPVALISALGIEAGEEMSWEVLDRNELHLVRINPPEASTEARVTKENPGK